MSVQSEITRIIGNIANAYSAVGSKGGTLPAVQNSANLATAILSIPRGATEPYIEETYNASGNLTGVVMHGHTVVRHYLFYNCTSLTLVTIPSSVTSIGDYVFYGCTSLASVTIPANVTSIGNEAFRGCTGFTEVTIPANVTSIGNRAFYGCTGLTSVSIPEGVRSIGNYAFQNCSNLTYATIACATLGTGSRILGSCTSLYKVWIRNTCTTITASSASSAPFANCPDNLQIYCEATSKPSGYGTYFNRTGSNGSVTVTVVYGETTQPW